MKSLKLDSAVMAVLAACDAAKGCCPTHEIKQNGTLFTVRCDDSSGGLFTVLIKHPLTAGQQALLSRLLGQIGEGWPP